MYNSQRLQMLAEPMTVFLNEHGQLFSQSMPPFKRIVESALEKFQLNRSTYATVARVVMAIMAAMIAIASLFTTLTVLGVPRDFQSSSKNTSKMIFLLLTLLHLSLPVLS